MFISLLLMTESPNREKERSGPKLLGEFRLFRSLSFLNVLTSIQKATKFALTENLKGQSRHSKSALEQSKSHFEHPRTFKNIKDYLRMTLNSTFLDPYVSAGASVMILIWT